MNKYRVFVRGENFLLKVDSQDQKLGFYVTVFVEATDEHAAETKAMDLLRNDPKLVNNILNTKADAPLMFVDELEELEAFEEPYLPRTGFSFFPQDSLVD